MEWALELMLITPEASCSWPELEITPNLAI